MTREAERVKKNVFIPEGQVKHFFTKIAGISHKNDDGSSRQRIAERACRLEELTLDHDENNPYDENAVKVKRPNGEQLGFLSADLAKEVVRRSRNGVCYNAFAMQLTGGGDRSYGMNILMLMCQPGTTNEQAQAYIERLRANGELERQS